MNLPPPPAFALPPPSDDETPMKRILVKVKKILGEQNILLEMTQKTGTSLARKLKDLQDKLKRKKMVN